MEEDRGGGGQGEPLGEQRAGKLHIPTWVSEGYLVDGVQEGQQAGNLTGTRCCGLGPGPWRGRWGRQA